MYVQGVSTRKVIEVLQKLVGPEVSISSTQISRCTALLDTGLQAWRTRPLDETPYVIIKTEARLSADPCNNADALPKNPSGKLLKRELRQTHAALFSAA